MSSPSRSESIEWLIPRRCGRARGSPSGPPLNVPSTTPVQRLPSRSNARISEPSARPHASGSRPGAPPVDARWNKASTVVVASDMQVTSEWKGLRTMQRQKEETSREAILVEDAHIRPMMGFEILELLPSRTVPYAQVDPFILVHEARFRLSELQDVDTKHPHRGFDNLWYILAGVGQHRPQHGARRSHRARTPARGRAPGAQDGEGRVARRGDRRGAARGRPRRHRMAQRALLGEPRSQGQAGRAERTGAAPRTDHRAEGRRRIGAGAGRRGLTPAAGDTRDRLRHRARRWRSGHHAGPVRVPGIRLPARRRGHVRCQRGAGEASAARAARVRARSSR